MSRLEVLGREVTAVRVLRGPTEYQPCMLPAPRKGEVCSLPTGHPGDHEVQVLAFVTIDRFTSDTENPMQDPQPDRDQAAEQRAKNTDRTSKPAKPRSRPTPHDVRPPQTGEQR